MKKRAKALFAAMVLVLTARAAEPPMELEDRPFQAERVSQTLSIGARHHYLRRLDWTQPELTVTLPCLVDRQSGRVLDCLGEPEGGVSLLQRNTAEQLARGLVFGLSPAERSDPRGLRVAIPVRLAQADMRPLDFEGPALRYTELPFVTQPGAAEIERAFPVFALREGVGALVGLLCQVQSDGSLVCRDPQVTQSGTDARLTRDFARAAERLVLQYQVAAQLSDGRPSDGAIVAFAFEFSVAE
ncbi:MAG: hypothetical protein RL026_295 [Pseudomonadota bacterium]|jgi:hypothetical protein